MCFFDGIVAFNFLPGDDKEAKQSASKYKYKYKHKYKYKYKYGDDKEKRQSVLSQPPIKSS